MIEYGSDQYTLNHVSKNTTTKYKAGDEKITDMCVDNKGIVWALVDRSASAISKYDAET